MRVQSACAVCRSRRRKCIFGPGQKQCTYCQSKALQCTGSRIMKAFPVSGQSDRQPPLAPRKAEPQELTIALPPVSVCLELAELYFDLIHDQFHSLFHRPSFTDAVFRGEAPPVILYAMLALSARFSTNAAFTNAGLWDRSSGYARESAMLLDLRDLSLCTIQACVLLGTVSRSEGDGAAESVYYSVASRIANLIDLANLPAANAIEREVNIRVWWTLSKIDTWSSAGVGLPRQMVYRDNVPLPSIDEATFLQLRQDEDISSELTTQTDRPSSLIAQMIILNRILTEINDFHTTSVTRPGVLTNPNEIFQGLSDRLDTWHASLPSYMHDTPENLRHYGELGLGRIFVAVYLGYYHFGQLLFYQYLHEDCHSSAAGNSNTIVHLYAQKCKTYASSLCDIVYASHRTPNCDVLYTMVGHNLVISSTIQIHTLLFSDSEDSIRLAHERLEKNFEILLRLRNFWPVLEISFEAFRTFREACRRSMDTAFMMDDWMLRFLYGFANKLQDKELYEAAAGGVWPVVNIGFSPGDWIDGG